MRRQSVPSTHRLTLNPAADRPHKRPEPPPRRQPPLPRRADRQPRRGPPAAGPRGTRGPGRGEAGPGRAGGGQGRAGTRTGRAEGAGTGRAGWGRGQAGAAGVRARAPPVQPGGTGGRRVPGSVRRSRVRSSGRAAGFAACLNPPRTRPPPLRAVSDSLPSVLEQGRRRRSACARLLPKTGKNRTTRK